MGFPVIGYLIAHARFENKSTPVFEFRDKFTLDAQQNVTFHTPMICQVTGRVINHSNSDWAEGAGSPGRDTGGTCVHRCGYCVPFGDSKRDALDVHVRVSIVVVGSNKGLRAFATLASFTWRHRGLMSTAGRWQLRRLLAVLGLGGFE